MKAHLDTGMELIRGICNIRPRHRGCVATIGNFDGVHLGHRAMLDRLREQAERRGLPATVISFEPHPREYFAPEQAPARLSSLRDKLRLLTAVGVNRLVCLHFDRRLAMMEPEAFIGELLVERLGVRYLLVGDDFRFGRARRGDHALLQEAAGRYGFELAGTTTVSLDGERVSSTRVRQALARGDLALAWRLLGEPYSLSGRVIPGDRLGRRLGCPTANIAIRHRPPLDGVAVVEAAIDGGAWQPAVASVGTRPTVHGTRPLCEVHLLDWSGDLYRRRLTVRFLHWLRAQQAFPNLARLQAQIAWDVAAARRWFAAGG